MNLNARATAVSEDTGARHALTADYKFLDLVVPHMTARQLVAVVMSLTVVRSKYSVTRMTAHDAARVLYCSDCNEGTWISSSLGGGLFSNGCVITREMYEWETAMAAQGLLERTIRERIRLLSWASDRLGVDPMFFTTDQVARLLAGVEQPWTRYDYGSILRVWFDWLVLTERIASTPMSRMRGPKLPPDNPRPASLEHWHEVLDSPLYHMTRTRIMFAAFAGLRVSEIAQLHSREFDREAGTMLVHSKGGRRHVIPVHPLLVARAARYRAGYLVPGAHRKGHVSGKSVSASISDAFRRHGYSDTAHQLRHLFATQLLRGGVDSRVVHTLMRHRSLATTARYLEVNVGQQREALSLLPCTLIPPYMQ
ncbi:MAG: tyrosine-type recombinase/integrase [Actinomycetaceae bacterium]|nr:tyrosine-type recombinase/integrase [Actinomycetaceae bacterium]